VSKGIVALPDQREYRQKDHTASSTSVSIMTLRVPNENRCLARARSNITGAFPSAREGIARPEFTNGK
jgi:hypothetical protein